MKFKIGDTVLISKFNQDSHVVWLPAMDRTIGKTCKIISDYWGGTTHCILDTKSLGCRFNYIYPKSSLTKNIQLEFEFMRD